MKFIDMSLSGEALWDSSFGSSKIFLSEIDEFYPRFEETLKKYQGGWVIKDVNNPYVTQRYLAENPGDYVPLFIQRPLTDVLYCLWTAGWYWPVKGLPGGELSFTEKARSLIRVSGVNRTHTPRDWHFSQGIPKLAEALAYVDNCIFKPLPNQISYNNMTRDHRILTSRLRGLGFKARHSNYINQEFIERRRVCRDYRKKEIYWVMKSALLEAGADPRRV